MFALLWVILACEIKNEGCLTIKYTYFLKSQIPGIAEPEVNTGLTNIGKT